MPDGGFTYFRSGAEREAEVEVAPQAEEQVEPEPEDDDDEVGDEYPEDGTIPAVKRWIGEDVERAQYAYDQEQQRDTPRSTLLEFLEDMLSEPDEE